MHITKNHKQFGIKNYKLCDMTGCTYGRADTWEWTGKMRHRYDSYIGNSKTLHETVEGVGYKLCMDNFFYSPGLFDDTYTTAIKCCGTVKQNHMEMPEGFDSKTIQYYLRDSLSNAISVVLTI
jgi:hypothetical protein